MTRKARTSRMLGRRPPVLKPRECVLIVCEGEKTEPNYFEGLRQELKLSSVEVEVEGKGCGSAPISVVDAALQRRAQREQDARYSTTRTEYDVVWCIVDVEIPPHTSLDRAFDKAKGNGLKLALSNPCFEYWYLLHFQRTSALMQSAKAVGDALKRHYGGYEKNNAASFQVFYPRTEEAIKHAKAVLREKHFGQDLRKCNPSTHVHRVVEHLKSIPERMP